MSQPDRKYEVFNVETKDIVYDWEFNCRDQFTLESVKDLADTIRAEGLHFPLVVQPKGEGNEVKWKLICGHRRFMAVTSHLGWKKVPAMIRDDLTDYQARMLNIRENLERKNLNLLEEAKAIQSVFPDGVSLRVAAKAFNRSERWVQTRQRLMLLPPEVQRMAAAELISGVDIDTLVKIKGTPQEITDCARQRADQRQRKPTKKKTGLFKRNFQQKKSKEQINKMVELLWFHKIEGLPPRLLAWANGYVSDEEIKQEIRDASGRKKRTAKDD